MFDKQVRQVNDKLRLKQRSIPVEGEGKPHVVIIGGGIAGLTVAHELVMENLNPDSECNVDITIVEKHPKLGGKARTEWDGGKFAEHSMRVLPGSYVCMHQIMKEIPLGNGTVIDRLTPVTIRFQHGQHVHTILGDYRTLFLGSIRYFRDVIRLLWFLRRSGVRLLDLYVFVSKVFRLLLLPSRRVTEQLSRLKFSDYVGGEDGRPGRFDLIYRAAEILVAAKSHSSAGVVSRTLLEWFVTPFLRGRQVRHAVSEFNAATSDALIQPWKNFLNDQGVHFENGTLSKIDAESGRVTSALLDDKRHLEGDVYVLAVQHNLVGSLIGDGLRKYVPALENFPRLGEEWAHSVQFRIPELQGELARLGSTSVAVMDSPWSIAYRVYSESAWPDSWPGAQSAGVFTATISNTRRPGKLFHLPFLRCTPEQILREVVAQTGLTQLLNVSDGALGLDLQVMSPTQAEKYARQGYAIAAIGPNEKRVYVTDAQMYIRLPGNLDLEPENETGAYNFFLAGEYTRTRYRIPTMEKSCESGKRCARAIIAGLGCAEPRAIPTCHLPLRFIRDEFFQLFVRRAVWIGTMAAILWLILQQLR